MAGIYIHIPFCASRCTYCAFFSSTSMVSREAYVEALRGEMRLRKDYIASPGMADTLYLGGGTPSLLSPDELEAIFTALHDEWGLFGHMPREITIEANPDDVTDVFAETIGRLPINRVSMGAQTFSDQRLRLLRRRHKASAIAEATQRLRRAGINNISIDLIYGFPGQTLSQWDEDLSRAISLDVEHISAYSLTYEEGTALDAMRRRGTVREVEEDISRAMFERLIDRLASAGYEHYEISNFARSGRRSQHNSSYWQNKPYIGLGAAAHSFDGHSRQWNVSNIPLYIKGIKEGKPVVEREDITEEMAYNEWILTALRTSDGLDLNEAQTRFPPGFIDHLIRQAAPDIRSGLLTHEGHRIRLTREGIFVSDGIILRLAM